MYREILPLGPKVLPKAGTLRPMPERLPKGFMLSKVARWMLTQIVKKVGSEAQGLPLSSENVLTSLKVGLSLLPKLLLITATFFAAFI